MADWKETLLTEAAAGCKDTAALKEILKAMAAHPSLSPDNVLLLRMQMPNATAVGGYKAWTEWYRRTLPRDVKPVVLLKPTVGLGKDAYVTEDAEQNVVSDKSVEFATTCIGYAPVHLYDISQTIPDDGSEDVKDQYPLTLDDIVTGFRSLMDCDIATVSETGKLAYYNAEKNTLELATESKNLIAEAAICGLARFEAERRLPDTNKLYVGLVAECAANVLLRINAIEPSNDIFFFAAWNGAEGKNPEQYLELLNQIYWTSRRAMTRLRYAANQPVSFDFDEVCLLNQLMTSNNKERLMEQLRELVKHTEVPVLIEAANNLCEKLDMFDDAKVRQIYEDRCNRKILTQPIYII